MINTGVFATKEEIEQAQLAAKRAASMPVIAFSSRHALEEGGLSGQEWRSAQELCHQFALEHGLPEITGYYGMKRNGEFIRL